jgi:threonine aldolase
MDPSETAKIFASCTRFLSGHYPLSPQAVFQQLSQEAADYPTPDRYGTGLLIETFEQEIAELLGKDAAVFMVSGTMAQQIALRLWAERRQVNNVAFHPLCHLELREDMAYRRLHGLHGVLAGAPERLLTLADLQQVRQPLAAILLELPQREIGGQLPTWKDLLAQTSWAREQGIPMHLDGARLWESAPFYQRSYAEISALFDSVYVSFYKSIGGIAGAAMAGPADFIQQARLWQHRHGGLLFQQYPLVLSARLGLRQRLSKMPAYHQKALSIARVLSAFAPRLEILPNPPCTHMMQVYLQGDPDRLQAAALEIARQRQVCLLRQLFPTSLPGWWKFEISVGDAALDLSDEEINQLFQSWLG